MEEPTLAGLAVREEPGAVALVAQEQQIIVEALVRLIPEAVAAVQELMQEVRLLP